MKLGITYKHLAQIVKGKISGPGQEKILDSFVTDTRKLKEGDTFWALKGEKFDANDFLADAVSSGAAALIVTNGRASGVETNILVIEVEDTLAALQTLAAWHRERMNIKVAAITGSNGKSTVKQMLKAICESAGPTAANIGNLNNQFGVPFSLLEITPDKKYGVFELGASKKGDIAEIAGLARPDVAILTNVSAAHLLHFKDLDTVYQTKTEIIDYINFGGTLVYNADDVYLRELKLSYNKKAISYGFKSGADLRIKKTDSFSFVYKGQEFSFPLVLARHNKLNAAAACAGAIALGMFKDALERGLAAYTPMPMRLEVRERENSTLIADCYNANPASMATAIDMLSECPRRPLIAVLGDMKELGKASKRYHAQLAKTLVGKKIDYIFLAGKEMAACHKALITKNPNIKVEYSKDYADWTPALKKLVRERGGTALIKASRSMCFENIAKEI